MAKGVAWISSRNNSVFDVSKAHSVILSISLEIFCKDRVWKILLRYKYLSKLISASLSFLLAANRLTNYVLPTCRAPLSTRGFLLLLVSQ